MRAPLLECRLSWHRPLLEGGCRHLFAGRVELAAVADEVLDPDPAKRMRAMVLMYSFNEPLHPVTFARGWSGLGLLERVVNVYNEDRNLKRPAVKKRMVCAQPPKTAARSMTRSGKTPTFTRSPAAYTSGRPYRPPSPD